MQHATTPDNDLVVRRFFPAEWPLYRDLRLRALAEAPAAFGSTFAAERERTDDEWRERLARGATSPDELPLLAEWQGEPSGLAWVRADESSGDNAHLYQMWVAPDRRRHGVARALVAAAVAWARSRGATHLELNVACDNDAAVRLYERAGFLAYGEVKPVRTASSILAQSMRRALHDDPVTTIW